MNHIFKFIFVLQDLTGDTYFWRHKSWRQNWRMAEPEPSNDKAEEENVQTSDSAGSEDEEKRKRVTMTHIAVNKTIDKVVTSARCAQTVINCHHTVQWVSLSVWVFIFCSS